MKTTARVLSILLVLVCLLGCLSMVTASATPTSSTVTTDKTAYAVNENVTFTISTNGSTNHLWIYRVDGQWQDTILSVGNTYTMAFGWAGEYKALVEAWDGTGSLCSSVIYFTIGDTTPPTSATIGADKSVYKVGDVVTFSMAGNGTTNTLWVYKPDSTREYFQGAGTSYSYIPTMAGQYEALMETWNGAGSFCSEKIKFRVVDPNAPVTTVSTTTTKVTTQPTTTQPTTPPVSTTQPTTPPVSTTQPTTAPTTRPTQAPTTRPRVTTTKITTTAPITVTAPPLTTHPCASGHNYGSGGYCVNCYAADPNYQPSINDYNGPADADTGSGLDLGALFGNFWLWFWLAVALFVVFVTIAIVLIVKRNNAEDAE